MLPSNNDNEKWTAVIYARWRPCLSFLVLYRVRHVTKTLIEMCPLSIDGAILILVFLATVLRICLAMVARALMYFTFMWLPLLMSQVWESWSHFTLFTVSTSTVSKRAILRIPVTTHTL